MSRSVGVRIEERRIFIGDTPKNFGILQSESKMQQVFGKNVKVLLPRSYQSAEATKGKVLVFKEVSSNVTLDDFKELLDYNKIQVETYLLLKSNVTT